MQVMSAVGSMQAAGHKQLMVQAATYPLVPRTQGRGTQSSGTGRVRSEMEGRGRLPLRMGSWFPPFANCAKDGAPTCVGRASKIESLGHPPNQCSQRGLSCTRRELNIMKMFLWILFGLFVTGIAFWMITVPGVPKNPLLMLLVVVVFAVPPFGAFWMLYVSIRHEKHPLPMMLLAFVPYAFLWYYLERVRPGKHLRDSRTTERQ